MNACIINYFKTAMLFCAPLALISAAGYAIAGWPAAALSAAAWFALAALIFFSADRRILKQHRAEYIPERQAPGLYALLGEVARLAETRRPALYLLPETAPEMLVTGTTVARGAIGLSNGLLQLLSTEEQAAVMAHAIHHLRSRETQPMAMVAGAVAALIRISKLLRLLPANGTRSEKGGGSDGVLWMLMAPSVALLVRAIVCASRQFRADVASAHLIGDAHALCTALIKIELRTPHVAPDSVSPATAHLLLCAPQTAEDPIHLFQTQPPIAERLRRLEELRRAIHYFDRLMKLRHANE
jgi:heat shock protein HtpX